MTSDAAVAPRPAILRYAYAVLSVMVALGAALALRDFDLEGFLFVIAVPVAVWLGGRGPGVFAVVLSALTLHYVFIAPEDTGAMLPSYAYFVVFSLLAAVTTVFSESRHRAERSLVQARDELDAKVRERTSELQRSNEQLRGEVAERRAAEAEVRKLAELLSLAHDAVIVRELDGRITFWNRGAEETYGWSAKEAVGRVAHDLLRTTFPSSRRQIETAMEAQGRWDGELEHVRRDGETIDVASRWSLQRDEHGVPTAILEINRDITDRKRTEEALRASQAELAHVTRVMTLGEVTASLAHEVNQPLAAIANNANACIDLLPAGRPGLGEIREALRDITNDADRASKIVERVRGLATRSAPEKTRLRVQDVVEEVVALTAGAAAARQVTVHAFVPADLPPVSADRVQLLQVLLNLVVNGMDAMSSVEERERLLEMHARLDADARVTVCVRDRGVGLTAAQMPRLFEAFYTTKTYGMGMGLAISRSIIEDHGGRLWAEPNQGRGATFAFSLPAVPLARDGVAP